jgi:hypothetical protein
MRNTTQRSFRRIAPAVLLGSLLFLGLSDASASCLAAWLCPPAAAPDCAGEHRSGEAWRANSELCTFEPRVDRASQKLDSIRLHLFDAAAAPFAGPSVEMLAQAVLDMPGDPADRSPPPPLYRLQAALLL